MPQEGLVSQAGPAAQLPRHLRTRTLNASNSLCVIGALQGERYRIRLGGLVETRDIIRRSRRIMFVACGTSYHAALAARQTVSTALSCVVQEAQLGLLTAVKVGRTAH
jgi:hypothetical protein